MRPNNPNKRLRGRNRSKNANPLARSYESNGPDVKIRGSALQVADKYAQLARDAQSAGDRVMAENYFQHAEHYYRIVAAAYEQQQQSKDKRDDHGDRPSRNDHGGEQPIINGYDGVDDDDGGVRRTLRGVNGADHHDDEDDDGEATTQHVNGRGANGSHHAAAENEPQDNADSTASPEGAAGETAEAAPEEEQKPKRRTRATRSRRSRKTDANGEGQPAPAEPEAAESTN